MTWCKRHPIDQRVQHVVDGAVLGYNCIKCGKYVSREKSLRGKRARQRGNAQERKIANDTGGKRVGHHGGKEDVISGIYSVQSKKDNGLFPERIWKVLASVPAEGGQVPALVLRDAPGPGTKVRGIVVLKYEDWLLTTNVRVP